ncbi:hypothetical protein ABPG72_013991 [Tetrahymena utriculariae]
MEKTEYRSYIKGRTLLGVKPIDIHRELNDIMEEEVPHYSTVTRLSKSFNEGRMEVEDLKRTSSPKSAINDESIKQIRDLIEEDPHITYDEMEEQTTLSRGTIFNIIKYSLGLKKITSRFVPYILTVQNKQKRVEYSQQNLNYFRDGAGRLCDILTENEVFIYQKQIGRKQSNKLWVGQGQKPFAIKKPNNYDKKYLFSILFRSTGWVYIHLVGDRQQSIDNQYYINNILVPALQVIRDQRPKSGTKIISLLHDNARAHTHENVLAFLKQNQVTPIKHPPYSPDLSPCHYWLFDFIKQRLGDHTNEESLFEEVTKILNKIPISEYKKAFEKRIERLELCVKYQGEYFEHLLK